MEDAKCYHILYADDVRFNSLAAQIYGKVTEKLTEEEQIENTNTSKTGFDIKLAQHERGSSNNNIATQSIHYTLKDALYFEILEELGIDPSRAEKFTPDIVDGEIHVLSGNMKISGASVINPILDLIKTMFPYTKKNQHFIGMKNDKNYQKQFNNINSMIEILPKMPIPTIFKLTTSSNEIISGPIDETASRLNMANMMLLFKGQLPFSWQVIGYLYPSRHYDVQDTLPTDFLGNIEKGISEFSSFFLPQSDAIMFPLLIMR